MTSRLYRHARFFTKHIGKLDLATINRVLDRYPMHLLDLMHHANIKLYALAQGEGYNDASASLRRLGVNVDTWPIPPPGLTVVDERTVYLRYLSAMTISHEWNHGLDIALGAGTYFSSRDGKLRKSFANARAYITSYASTAIDEYWAESVRAFVEQNDSQSPWPKATRARLKELDPTMYDIVAGIFAPPQPEVLALPIAFKPVSERIEVNA